MLTRRTALLTSLVAGACTSLGENEPPDAIYRDLASPSESVHSGVASEDGERRLTVRLCRYPDLGLAWIWIHARTPEGFFSHVDHMAPCGRDATASDLTLTTYSDLNRSLVFERTGPVDKPVSAQITGSCLARKSAESRFGPGTHSVDVSIAFTAARLYSGLNPGRTEVFGRSKASVTVDGRRYDIEGPAQFHEQRQTGARFGRPFCYISLWGEDAASTMLIAPARRDGYMLEGDRSVELASIALDPPAERRAMRVGLADGRRMEGEARVMQAYTLPIYGNRWRGHMVKVELGDRPFVGHINDYVIAEGVPYSG